MAAKRGEPIRQPQVARRNNLRDKLRERLEEAEETLRAIRSGEVDALVVTTPDGDRLFTLQGADQSYRALMERMNEGALSLNAEGMIMYANQCFATLLRAPLEQVIGSQLAAWIAPASAATLQTALETGQREQCREEVLLAAADGSSVPVYLSINRVPLDGVHNALGVVATNLTDQKRAERTLQLSEAQFRNVFENSLLGNRLIGMDGAQKVNRSLCEMTGYSEQELQEKSWEAITYPDDARQTAEAIQRLMDGSATQVRLERRLIHKSGRIVWVDATLTVGRDESGQPLYVLIANNDITARKLADDAVLVLKQHLQQNIEMERLRLAQDLHDVPLQELYGVMYRLEELRMSSDARTSEVISQAIRDIQQTLGSLRAAASELRPPALSRFGLEKAIRSYMHEFQEKNPGLHVRLLLAHDHQLLPEDVRLVLFRVLQEAAANAKRHAQASEVRVRFNFDAEEARIEISDNGQGFSVPGDWLSMVRDGHYGLAGMSERVTAAGGTLEVNSVPGAPTTVRVVIPYTPGSGASAWEPAGKA